jgi:histidinol-phosphate aminotransferase
MTGPVPRPGILDIQAYRGGDAKLPGFDNPICLASNESALGPSPYAIEAFRAAGDHLNRYADGAATALREALAAHHGIEADRIACGNGSDELIGLLTKAYAGRDDEVLFSEHGFAMYPIATLAAGARPVTAKDDALTASVDGFLEKLSERTKIVFLANPNNPTGTYLPTAEVQRLHAALPEHVLLVIDAAYAEYVSRNDYTAGLELARTAPNVVMTRTFSKIYGLAGLRVGWCYGAPSVIDVLNRTRGPFNLNAGGIAAATAAVGDVAHLDRVRTHNDEWLPWFRDQVNAIGLEALPSIGNFVLVRFANGDGRDAEAANAFLNGKGIIPRKVAGYGLPDCLRITIGLEGEMRATVDALREFVG